MDKLDIMIKDKINCAAEEILPRRNISESAERRLAKKAPKRKLLRIAASVCIAAVMCGTVVSAIKFNWLGEMFGTEEFFSAGNVSTENIFFEKYENAPSDLNFKLLEAVSDGEVIILNFELSGSLTSDTVHERMLYIPKRETEYNRSLTSAWWIKPLSDGTYGQFISPDCGINSGDSIELTFIDDETNTLIGKASFTISEDVLRLAKDIKVGKKAKICDQSKEYIAEKELIVDSITLSALSIKINYLTKDNSNNYAIGKDISLVTDDGQKIPIDSGYSYDTSTNLPKDDDGYYKQYIAVETQNIISPEKIASICIGDLTVQLQ